MSILRSIVRKDLVRRRLAGTLIVATGLIAATVAAAGNIDPNNRFAYAENVGWVNAEPVVLPPDGHPGILVGDHELGGWMWGENVGWISLTCENTFSCTTASYAVVNSGSGVLSGYAWGENVGWINFAPTGGGVTINPSTGDFSGYAWGENIGWISFASVGPNPFKVRTEWSCVPLPAAPSGVPLLLLGAQGGGTLLTWDSVAVARATGFDIVRGDLDTLRTSGGNFALATAECLDNDRPTMAFLHTASPAAGEGWWYLVRGVNCGGNGTYHGGSARQHHDRDPGIAASGHDCP